VTGKHFNYDTECPGFLKLNFSKQDNVCGANRCTDLTKILPLFERIFLSQGIFLGRN
jgi:hypothetical protein